MQHLKYTQGRITWQLRNRSCRAPSTSPVGASGIRWEVSLQLKLLPNPSMTRELLCQAGDSGEGWGPQVAAWFPSAPSSRGCGCTAPGRFLGDFCWKQLLVGTGWMVSGCFSLAG